MTEFSPSFEAELAAGVSLNNKGEYQEALDSHFRAYDMAGSDILTAGRAARDIGHTFANSFAKVDDGKTFATDESENRVLAEAYGMHAVYLHRQLESVGDNAHAIRREQQASAGYLGTTLLAHAIGAEKAGDEPRMADTASDALRYLRDATEGQPDDDQYTINFIARDTMARALYSKQNPITHITRAWRLGRQSENPAYPHSNPNLSPEARRVAKMRALARAAGASTIQLLRTQPTDSSCRRTAALALAERLL